MNAFSAKLVARSGYKRDGFADVYDAYRPTPPTGLLDILQLAAQVERSRLVVDLGAGTGLSTRVWAERADEVVGVEPNESMLERARVATTAPNVRYVEGFAATTGLPSGGADIVTCAQAFHWMEPAPVLAEAARLLRTGGVFAAYDYDVPPLVQPEVDAAFAGLFSARKAARKRLGIEAGAATWPKERTSTRSAPAASSVARASSSATASTRRAPYASSVSPRASVDRGRCSTGKRRRSRSRLRSCARSRTTRSAIVLGRWSFATGSASASNEHLAGLVEAAQRLEERGVGFDRGGSSRRPA